MYPILFEYKFLKISSYGFMLMLAFLICNHLLKKYLKSIDVDESIGDDLIFNAAIGGILGSKIYYIIEFWHTGEGYNNLLGLKNIFIGIFDLDINLIFSGINQFGSGLVFLGGLLGGLIFVTIYIKRNNLNWLSVSDWIAPYLALGHSIGRIGCFLVGDCYGKPCALPWGVSFPNGLPPTTYESFKYNYYDIFIKYIEPYYQSTDIIHVHPTQLYESLLYFCLFYFLSSYRKIKKFNGEIFLEYLFLAGIIRFIIEVYRLNPLYFLNLSGAQYISLFMIIISSIFFYLLRKNTLIEK